jgi:hypothetical protein
MCWVSVDQVLKQATRVKNSLCLSRACDGVFRRAWENNQVEEFKSWFQDKIIVSSCVGFRLIKSWIKQLEWRIYYASQEIVMEFLEGQVMTKMIFIVELDMVMKEPLVILSWSNEGKWRVHCGFQETKMELEVKMLVDQDEARRLYLDGQLTKSKHCTTWDQVI